MNHCAIATTEPCGRLHKVKIFCERKSKSLKPSSGDCVNRLAPFPSEMETEVDNQVAAPAETRTPNLHRARIAHQECGWKGGDSGDSAGRKNLVRRNNKGNPLTPTGLLMEGDYTH